MQILEAFECSDQNSSNSRHFWNDKSAFLQILYQSSASWDINSSVPFSWNFIYFQQKEPIKVQIWWNFPSTVRSLKFCTLMDFFCQNHIKLLLKKYRRVISYDTEEWIKVYRKIDLWFQIWHEVFWEFSPNPKKVWKFHFDGLFLSKVSEVWAKKYKEEFHFMTVNSEAKFE